MDNISFFLDSGAFSANSQGKPIDVMDYIAFIKKHESLIDIYPVLDVIGDAEATWENQYIMEEHDLVPMPVFHVEDHISYLEECLEYDYFCLGGMAGGASSKSRQHFLNTCFEIICDTPDRTPKCKVHGFGLAAPSLMVQFPFYSVDTSSWVSYSQFGIILLPKRNSLGLPMYGETPIKIFVTARSPKNSMEGLHYNNLTSLDRQAVDSYVKKMGFQMGTSSTFECGEDYELQESESFMNKEKTLVERAEISGISNNNSLRYSWNMRYFQSVADSCPEWPWPWKTKIRSWF